MGIGVTNFLSALLAGKFYQPQETEKKRACSTIHFGESTRNLASVRLIHVGLQ